VTSFAPHATTNGAWKQTQTDYSTATETRLARCVELTAATRVTTATSSARPASTSGGITGTAAWCLACGPVARGVERQQPRPNLAGRFTPDHQLMRWRLRSIFRPECGLEPGTTIEAESTSPHEELGGGSRVATGVGRQP